MAVLQDINISQEVAQPQDITTAIRSLSVYTEAAYETKTDAEGKLQTSEGYTDQKFNELSSELSNYWKIKKFDDDPTKVVSQEMDFLVMRDQAPKGTIGSGIGRYMYVITDSEGNAKWECNTNKNTIPDKTENVEARTGTKTRNLVIG